MNDDVKGATTEEQDGCYSSFRLHPSSSTVAPELGDVPADEFRRLLHEVADWVADYRAELEARRVAPTLEPGAITKQLPAVPPANAEPMRDVLRDLDRVIMPGIVHWGHPAFLGYFATTTTAPGILGEMIAAALNVSAMSWQTSPAATELEAVVLDWVRQMLGLPVEFRGVVYDTASIAVVHALAAAREEAGYDVRRAGLAGRADMPTLTLYASDQAHNSLEKAAITLGLGEANTRRVATDDVYRMNVRALRDAIEDDVRAGRRPLAVVATVGTTSATSVDPVGDIADVCREYNVWLHVDAAYGGAMALLEEGRQLMHGVERADSVVFNPHKWLFVPLDFSVLYLRRPDALRRVFSLVPEYLRGYADRADGLAPNYMDYGIQLGRRFRALKAWFVIRAFGREGLASRVREACRLARVFAKWVEGDARFELLAPVEMAVVCFRGREFGGQPGRQLTDKELNALNERLLERVNATGEAYLTHTSLRGRRALRVAVGNVLTTERHLARVWELLCGKLDAN
ncbi:MAG: pyridoxal-dependent decarboxylase [Acidobacteriota bacterium]|nr:pyridoxal-dependent decarboxylase [Acidobacteriota bacterium]